VWWLTPSAEEEDGEKEDVLFNLAQTVNLIYFDYHSADVIGETTTETTPNIPSTHPVALLLLLLRWVLVAVFVHRSLRAADGEREEGSPVPHANEAHAQRVRAPPDDAHTYTHTPHIPPLFLRI
jgi:hypothetical protein